MQYAYSTNIIYALRICQEKNQDHFADINEMVVKPIMPEMDPVSKTKKTVNLPSSQSSKLSNGEN